jgi:integrase
VVPFLGGRRLNEISNNIMTKVMERWIGGGYPDAKGKPVKPTSSPKTLNNRKTVVNACLRFAVERGHIPLMPCRIDIRHVETDEAEHYETGTYERLLEGALALNDARVYVALLLGGDAGLRRGEILALRCEDVKFKTREVTVRRSLYWRRASKGREMVETLPKGKKVKPVATTARLLLALKKICGERTGRVLLTDEGGQLTPKIMKLWVIKAELAAGLPGTGRLHVLRHSHLTHLADAGASLLEIASQARHADLRITSRYLHAAGGAGGAARSGVNRLEEKRASAGGVGEGYPR